MRAKTLQNVLICFDSKVQSFDVHADKTGNKHWAFRSWINGRALKFFLA